MFLTECILQYIEHVFELYVYFEQYVWCIHASLYDEVFGAKISHWVHTNDAFPIMGSLGDLLQDFKSC